MVLSPNNRIVPVEFPNNIWLFAVRPFAYFTCTRTVDVGPTELLFPDSDVQYVVPGFGQAAFKIENLGVETWTEPFNVVLSQQAIYQPIPYVNLVAIALIPANGCQMDVTPTRT